MQVHGDLGHGESYIDLGEVAPTGVIVLVGMAHIGIILPGAVPEALHTPVSRGLVAPQWTVVAVKRVEVEGVIVADATVGIVLQDVAGGIVQNCLKYVFEVEGSLGHHLSQFSYIP